MSLGGRRRETTEAVVLSCVDSRDDVIVRLLAPELGNVPAVARHARKSVKRQLRGHLQPLTRVDVTVGLRPNRDLSVVESATAREPFACIKGDLARFGLATTMAEVVLHLVPDHGHEPGMYELLLRAMRHLDVPTHPASEELLLLFELRALSLSGVMPALEDVPGLGDAAREVLTGWLQGRWAILEPDERARVGRVLDAIVETTSGRRLKSRAFLASVLEP